MFVVLEVSRPFIWRPEWDRYAVLGIRFAWLFFAVHVIPMRFDEYTIACIDTGAERAEQAQSRE